MASEAGLTDISETDRMVYSVLSNPERVDLDRLPAARHADRFEELEPIREVPAASEQLHADAEVRTDHREPEAFAAPPPEIPDLSYPTEQPVEQPPSSPPRPQPPSPPRAPSPPPPASFEQPVDDADTRRTLLLDLRKLEIQGVKLSKDFTMEDSADDMTLEIRKHALAVDEAANVNMMRDGLRLFVTGLEMVNNRIGLLDLEGWSTEVCRDLHKHDKALGSIYRKYWRRSTSTSPEMDICLSLASSMGFHHMKRKMSKQILTSAGRPSGDAGGARGFSGIPAAFRKRPAAAGRASPPSSDDEEPPRRMP